MWDKEASKKFTAKLAFSEFWLFGDYMEIVLRYMVQNFEA